MDVKDWVWFYYNQGFSIIPLRKESKKPNIKTWEAYHKKRPTEKEIKQWLHEGKFQNIGVICGEVSNNLVVIDIDDKEIGKLLKLKPERIYESGGWIIQTGNGYHIYLLHKKNPGRLRKISKLKIEYRSNGGYVVAPPSTHPNGHQYKFINKKDFATLPELNNDKDVKSIFDAMEKQLRDIKNIPKKTQGHASQIGTKKQIDGQPECVKKQLKTEAKKGERNDTIYGLACNYRMQNTMKSTALQYLKRFNKEHCKEKLDDHEIERSVDSAYNENASLYGCEFWRDQKEMCPFETMMDCPIGKMKTMHDLQRKYYIFDLKETEKKDGTKFFKRVGVKPINLARLILNEYSYDFTTMEDSKEIFYYNDGKYHGKGENIIRALSGEYLEDMTKANYKNEVVDYIRDKNFQERTDFFKYDGKRINLENGVLNLEIMELEPHNPDYHFLHELPVKYNPDAKCPKITKFLEETFSQEDIPILQEFTGDCIRPEYRYKKAVILVGEKNTGKSQFLNLLERKFLGKENVSNESLYDLCTKQFSPVSLFGKLANISGDLESLEIKHAGIFKEITGGDTIRGEQKHMNVFYFQPYSKLIFSCNKIPEVKNVTGAYYDRWIPMICDNVVSKEDMIPNFYETISSDEELSGFLNWALTGLERLDRNKSYSEYRDLGYVKDIISRHGNSIAEFCADFVKPDRTGKILKTELYRRYLDFCNEKSYPSKVDNVFSRVVKQYLPRDFDEGQSTKGKTWIGFICQWKTTTSQKEIVENDEL